MEMEADCINTNRHELILSNGVFNNQVILGDLKFEGGCCHPVMLKEVSKEDAQVVTKKIFYMMVICEGFDHVSAFRGIYEVRGRFYYAMDRYKKTLKEEIEDTSGPLTAKKILKYGRDIARGMSELHDANIICMNLNPSNILIDEKGNMFISDYGIAHSIHAENTYNAPETWEKVIGKRIIYSLPEIRYMEYRSILLKMSSQYSLWNGLDTTRINTFVKQKKLPIVVSELVEGSLFEIIDGCLKFEQEERLSSSEIKTKFLNFNARNPITLRQQPKIVQMDETHQYLLERLHCCIQEDDYLGVRCLLEKSKNVDFLLKDEVDGLFAVLLACRVGSKKSLKELLNAGADANAIDGQGDYILHIAIGRKDHDCALLILEHNGSMRKLNSNNMTPLHLCIETRNRKLLPLNMKKELLIYVALLEHLCV